MIYRDVLIRLASLMTTFSDCRFDKGYKDCSECLFCTKQLLHEEYDALLKNNPEIKQQDPSILKPLLPQRVLDRLNKL